MSTTHSKKVGTTEVTIKADFANASDPIFARYSDCGEAAEFQATGKQVADFNHSSADALEYFAKEAA